MRHGRTRSPTPAAARDPGALPAIQQRFTIVINLIICIVIIIIIVICIILISVIIIIIIVVIIIIIGIISLWHFFCLTVVILIAVIILEGTKGVPRNGGVVSDSWLDCVLISVLCTLRPSR